MMEQDQAYPRECRDSSHEKQSVNNYLIEEASAHNLEQDKS